MILNLKQFYIEVQERFTLKGRTFFNPIEEIVYIGEETVRFMEYITPEQKREFIKTKESIEKVIADSNKMSQRFILKIATDISLQIFRDSEGTIRSIDLIALEKNIFDLPILKNFVTFLVKEMIISKDLPEVAAHITIAAPYMTVPELTE